ILFFLHTLSTSESYTLSLHDALPISFNGMRIDTNLFRPPFEAIPVGLRDAGIPAKDEQCKERGVTVPEILGEPIGLLEIVERPRSEEHTSELQSPCNLVCRLLLEKKK